MGKATVSSLFVCGAVRLFALGARAPVLDGAARRSFLFPAGLRALFRLGRSLLLRFGLFLARAQILFVLLEFLPALCGALSLDRKALRRLAVMRLVALRQLFGDGLGKADIRHRQHRAGWAAERSAKVGLCRGNLQTDALTRVAEMLGAPAGVIRRVACDQQQPCVFGAGGRAHRLLADLQLPGLFGKADQIEQLIHRLPSPFPVLHRRSRGWPCPARARARGTYAPA